MKNKITKIAAATGIMLGAFSLSVLAAWVAPTEAPPGCSNLSIPGCNPPLNTGPGLQEKANGSLRLQGLGITSSNFVFKPSAAGVLPGSVLKADDVNGTVVWGTPSSSVPETATYTVSPGTQRFLHPDGVDKKWHFCYMSKTWDDDQGETYIKEVYPNPAGVPDGDGKRKWIGKSHSARTGFDATCVNIF